MEQQEHNRAKPVLSELLLSVRSLDDCDSTRRGGAAGEQGAPARGKVADWKRSRVIAVRTNLKRD